MPESRIDEEPNAAFLIGDDIKARLQASWNGSTSLFLFSFPMRNAALSSGWFNRNGQIESPGAGHTETNTCCSHQKNDVVKTKLLRVCKV